MDGSLPVAFATEYRGGLSMGASMQQQNAINIIRIKQERMVSYPQCETRSQTTNETKMLFQYIVYSVQQLQMLLN